jgi:dipeptidyl aminopeptidase/acylaminoacyl peptidase
MTGLTQADPNYFVRGGDLHPNNRWLVFGANVDMATGQEIEPTWIYRLDLETGEQRLLASPRKGGYIWPELSPDGQFVLYSRKDLDPAGRQIWLVNIEGTRDHEILNHGPGVKTYAKWFPDSKRILVIDESKNHRRLGIWSLHNQAVTWILDDPQRDILTALAPYGSEQIVVVNVERARIRSTLLDPQTGRETSLPDVPGNLVPMAPAGDGEWVGKYYSSRQPVDVVRFQPEAGQIEQFSSLSRVWERTALTPDDFCQAKSFGWQSVDGLEIEGWLYLAPGRARGTIVFVHGGPTSHSEDQINNQIQFLVRHGFNVLDPNYRGSTGYGLSFRESIKVDGWGGLEQEDISSGIKALFAAGIAQPGKVGITGTSYGGYSAWCAITRQSPDIVAAAVPICGMTDLVVDYETTRPDLRPLSEEMMGGSPTQNPKRYHERSPIHFVNNIKGKLLIVQGLQDPNVTPENVDVVKKKLNEAGIDYEILAFADEGHGISRPENQRQLYLRLVRFFGDAFGE